MRTSLEGQLILPDDEAYDAARRLFFWNPTTEKSPGIIARCERPDDVARCVEFARQHDLVLAVRGGAHSFLGWSTCDDGLVIDVSPMKEIAVDPGNRTVRAGSGVVAYELVEATSPHDLVPVLGECPTVGISGLTLGGGLGWLSGKYGATCDNLLSAELMTADGQSIVANATENPDLFWAIRGGGGNFGIATSLAYRLHPLSAVFAGVLTYRLSDARAMLSFYRDFMAEAPDELQAVASLQRDGDPLLNLVVCFSGDLNDGEKIIRPLRTHANPVRDTVQPRAYSDSFTEGAGGSWTFSHIKACYLESLSEDAIDVMLDRFAHAPDPGAAIGLDHYMHGAVCRVAFDATAFELRSPGALHVRILALWNDPYVTAAIVEWSEETWNALQSHSAGRIYANYPSTEGQAAAKAAYGGNYSRLLAIKNKYDPSNIFRRNQNIMPSSA
ncbi:FAD-binding oxidoreductase [Acidobacteria bacterium AH-259-O06]|nr:FAD-binding oxidoreductase [Acidobacteria bacterium AH-259-O06]